MARWLSAVSSSPGAGGLVHSSSSYQLVSLLSSLVIFFVCVTKLVALCAAHSNPQVLNRESEPEGELAAETQSNRKLSHRFSAAAIQAKLSSFRKSSLRISNGSFRKSSFRSNGSFRFDCASQVDVVDALRPVDDAPEESTAGGPAVWQRAILRGERCAPLEFSGLILYDEKGNPLPLQNGAPPRPANLHPSARPYRSVTT